MTIFDSAKQKGLSTAAFMWPETVEDASIDYNVVTRADAATGRRELVKNAFVAELTKDGVPIAMYDAFRDEGGLGLVSDSITTLAACHTIRKHKPNLTAIHLVNTDYEQHGHGYNHPLAQAALSKADYNVGQIVRAMKEAGIWEQSVIIVGADYGFTSVFDEINCGRTLAEEPEQSIPPIKELGNTHGPVNLNAVGIDVIRRLGGAGRIELRLIRVELGVLKILEERAVKGVCAGLGHEDHRAAPGPSILRVVGIVKTLSSIMLSIVGTLIQNDSTSYC